MSSIYAAPDSNLDAQRPDALWNDLVVFAGYDYYARKWRALHAGQSRFAGFNFAALFFGPLWFVYRKMYSFALLALLAPVPIVFLVVALDGQQWVAEIADAAFRILVGAAANVLYYHHARRRLIATDIPPEAEWRNDVIVSLGAPNATAVWICLVAVVAGGVISVRLNSP